MAASLASPVDRDGRSPHAFLSPPPRHGFRFRQPHSRTPSPPLVRPCALGSSSPVEGPVPPLGSAPPSFERMKQGPLHLKYYYVDRESMSDQAKSFTLYFNRSKVSSFGGINISDLKLKVNKDDMEEMWCPYGAISDSDEFICLTDAIKSSSYSPLKAWNHVKNVEQMAFGPQQVKEKPSVSSVLDKMLLLSNKFDTCKNLLEPSVLVEPVLGIESLNPCYNWFVDEQDVNTWVPIERPLGHGAISSLGCAPTFIWLDSGCAHHVVFDYSLLVNCRAPPAGKNVRIVDGSLMPVLAIGTIELPGFLIPEVYYVPGAVYNLISPQQLAVHHKINSALDDVSCVLWTGQHIELVGEGILDERRALYRLTFLVVP